MKLATWNVALPVSSARRNELRSCIDQVRAEVLVLTETHDGFTPGFAFSCSSAEGRDSGHQAAHRWVTIWANHPLMSLPTTDKKRTAAARVVPETSEPFVVFGTVLPWIGSSWEGHSASGGVAFNEALRVQLGDWKRLHGEYPNDEFFVLGDFNQDLVSPRYYGSKTNRARLELALEEAGFIAVTAGDKDPIRRDSAPCACIDHICTRRDSRWRADSVERWPNTAKPLRRLSDHFGVAVTLVRS